jgi:hypothetical protein
MSDDHVHATRDHGLRVSRCRGGLMGSSAAARRGADSLQAGFPLLGLLTPSSHSKAGQLARMPAVRAAGFRVLILRAAFDTALGLLSESGSASR